MTSPGFYWLGATLKLSRRPETANRYSGVRPCPVDPDHSTRNGPRVGPITVREGIKLVDDFVWPLTGGCLITTEIKQLLIESNATGFEARPARVASDKGESRRLSGYVQLGVTGWGGIAPPASGIRLNRKESCTQCGHLIYTGLRSPGKLIDPAQWDGSDIFLVWPLPMFVFASERIAKVLLEHGVTGVRILPLEDFNRGANGFTPGRLSYYFPADRARKLGATAGIA